MPRPKAKNPTYTLELRGNSYAVRWWDGARSQRVSCRTSDRYAAEQFLADFKAGAGANIPPATITIGAILDGYQADRSRAAHSPALQFSVSALKRHLGMLSAELLTKERVEAYWHARRREGPGGASAQFRKSPRPLSDGTLIRELGVLRRALTWATEQNPPWLARAPHVVRPSSPEPRGRWLTREEAKRLLAGAEAPHIRLFIVLSLHTAHRSGAVLDLTWDRIDLTARTIDMGSARGKKRRSRHLPINDTLLPYLLDAAEARTTQWVIEFRGAKVASVKKAFMTAARRAGLPGVTPHVLRHTAVTWMMQSGVQVEKIAAYAAMSVQMVERHYGHHSPDWMRDAAQALAGAA